MSKLVERIKAVIQEVELGHAEYRPEYRDVVALLAHIERLQKDAKRYQWLRLQVRAVRLEVVNLPLDQEMDEAIDKALATPKKTNTRDWY